MCKIKQKRLLPIVLFSVAVLIMGLLCSCQRKTENHFDGMYGSATVSVIGLPDENTNAAPGRETEPTEAPSTVTPQYLQSGLLGDVRAYVIIPQLPSTQKGWINAAESVVELIEQTVSAYHINRSNISLTGHSMGGTGTWNPACAYPNLFARIAPLSGSIRTSPDIIEKLKRIPIRAFVGAADTIVPPDSSTDAVSALERWVLLPRSPFLRR